MLDRAVGAVPRVRVLGRPAAHATGGAVRRRFRGDGPIDELINSFNVRVINGGDVISFPKQRDGTSCGVFTVLMLWHIIEDATLHLKAEDVPTKWRAFIPIKILRFLNALVEAQ